MPVPGGSGIEVWHGGMAGARRASARAPSRGGRGGLRLVGRRGRGAGLMLVSLSLVVLPLVVLPLVVLPLVVTPLVVCGL